MDIPSISALVAADGVIVRTTKTTEEATDLLESGFDYVTEMNEVQLFRKRK